MRTSTASLTIIKKLDTLLLQWNVNWDAYSLIGGHVEVGETLQECCEREVIEELECDTNQFEIDSAPLTILRFSEFSKAAGEQTDYEWHVFKTELHESLRQNLPSTFTWVTPTHIRSGLTEDGKPIAGQAKRVLEAIEEQNAMNTNPPKFTWLSDASRDLGQSLIDQACSELIHVFGLVKLGDTDQVDGDCTGWDQCATRQGIASRMFIAPVSGPISEYRQAVIYSDVYQYYFDSYDG